MGYLDWQAQKGAVTGPLAVFVVLVQFMFWLAVAAIGGLVIAVLATVRARQGRLSFYGSRLVLAGDTAVLVGAVLVAATFVFSLHGSVFFVGLLLYFTGAWTCFVGGGKGRTISSPATAVDTYSSGDWLEEHRSSLREEFWSGRINLDRSDKDQLYVLASIEEIRGRSKMRKQELIAALRQLRGAS